MFYFNLSFPLVKSRSSVYKKTWVSNEAKKSSLDLKDLFLLRKRFPELQNKYLAAKKTHELLIKSIKKQYYNNLILNSSPKDQNKTVWNVISTLTNRTQEHKNIILNEQNFDINNPAQVANKFNTFFKEEPIRIISSIKKNYNSPSVTNIKNIGQSMYIQPFTEDEILHIVSTKLKNKMSQGPDDIPYNVVKKCMPLIVKPLTYLINLSLSLGIYPDELKLSKVKPIFKKGDPSKVENYRPVALSSVFAKIFEYCMLDRLLKFLTKFNILTNAQHGFRPSFSTSTAMDAFLTHVFSALDTGECPAGIFCDLTRAFDCVSHVKLLSKLECYGLRGIILDWFSSYLGDRQQYVEIVHKSNSSQDIYKSNYADIQVGVPQGSVLGPVLFLLYVNDLPDTIKNRLLVMYADDTSVLITGKSNIETEENCNVLLNEMLNWFNTNELYLNLKKTGYVRFHTRQNFNQLDIDIKCGEISLDRLKTVKFLGLSIDECLTWNVHCENLISKLNSICFQIRNLRTVLDEPALINFYHAQVHSRLSYAICFWGAGQMIQDIFITQKRIIRVIAGVARRHTCRELFKKFKILTVYGIYVYNLLQYIFNNKNKLIRNGEFHSYDTRHRDDFHIPSHRLNLSHNSPLFHGIRLYNNLPHHIKTSENINIFKRKIKERLQLQCLYSVQEFGWE